MLGMLGVDRWIVILLMEEILHQLIESLSHHLQGFIHPRWWSPEFFHQHYFAQPPNSWIWRSVWRGRFPLNNLALGWNFVTCRDYNSPWHIQGVNCNSSPTWTRGIEMAFSLWLLTCHQAPNPLIKPESSRSGLPPCDPAMHVTCAPAIRSKLTASARSNSSSSASLHSSRALSAVSNAFVGNQNPAVWGGVCVDRDTYGYLLCLDKVY